MLHKGKKIAVKAENLHLFFISVRQTNKQEVNKWEAEKRDEMEVDVVAREALCGLLKEIETES